ncbi:MAG: hypothetical protein ACQCN4_03890 [Candidatus Bathyarchaeia archaeon]
MSGSLKDTVNRLKELESQKLRLQTEVEELKRIAEAKASALSNDISNLKEDINALKSLMEGETPQLTSTQTLKEKKAAYLTELAEKTREELNQLGNQSFTTPPYSQNFDKWLADIRQTISDFEANCPVKDEQFTKEKSQILQDIESALSQKKIEESNIESVQKALAENSQLLTETEKEYTEKLRELSLKRNAEVEPLASRIRELEKELQSQEEGSKRKLLLKSTGKLPQTKQNLKSANDELNLAMQNLNAEQEKLRSEYDLKKKGLMDEAERLNKDLQRLKTDNSIEARQAACKALSNAVNSLIQRD